MSTEPRWTPINEVEDWSLGWFYKAEHTGRMIECDPAEWRAFNPECKRKVWGPFQIPDPPPPLPTLRRFEATYQDRRVVGVFCQDAHLRFRFTFIGADNYWHAMNAGVFTDIKWIDEEPSQ